MNRRAARLLTSLYPRPWRVRYGAEFEAFLVAGPRGLRAFTNVALFAFCEHLFPLGGLKMNRLPRSFGAILCAYLVVIAAGINFYLTIDDSSLAAAMRANPGLSTAWNVVALGSVAALLGAIAMLARWPSAHCGSPFAKSAAMFYFACWRRRWPRECWLHG